MDICILAQLRSDIVHRQKPVSLEDREATLHSAKSFPGARDRQRDLHNFVKKNLIQDYIYHSRILVKVDYLDQTRAAHPLLFEYEGAGGAAHPLSRRPPQDFVTNHTLTTHHVLSLDNPGPAGYLNLTFEDEIVC